MAYGDPLVTTTGPSYGQPIVRNVGSSGGSSFENPYPDPVTFSAVADFLQDIEMRSDKTIWLDTPKAAGLRYAADRILISPLLSTTGYPSLGVLADGSIELKHSSNRHLTTEDDGGLIILNVAFDKLKMLPFGLIETRSSVAGGASMRMPHGIAPDSPNDGDMWTTTAGLFVRVNGVTVGPLS